MIAMVKAWYHWDQSQNIGVANTRILQTSFVRDWKRRRQNKANLYRNGRWTVILQQHISRVDRCLAGNRAVTNLWQWRWCTETQKFWCFKLLRNLVGITLLWKGISPIYFTAPQYTRHAIWNTRFLLKTQRQTGAMGTGTLRLIYKAVN